MAIGATGARRQRIRAGSAAAATVRCQSSPFATPARPATPTVPQPGVVEISAPARVSSTKFSADQPNSSIVGNARHQPATTPARTRKGASTSIGPSEANRYQESATAEKATESAAQGEITTAASAATSRLRRTSQPQAGRGVPAGQASAVSPAESSPRASVTPSSPSTNVSHESW
jgi:hypothetical protein